MGAPTVLLYNLASEKGRRIKMLCLSLKIRARAVTPAEYGLPLEALLRGEAPSETSGEASFTDEMLVMAGLASSQMNALLQGFRRKKIPPVALKAVLTATNSAWDSRRLCGELKLEHEAMLRGESAHGEQAR